MIYFIQSPSGQIKIGTTANLEKRLAQLRTAFGSLSVLGVMPGGAKVEAALHAKFSDDSIAREWFRPSAALLAYISERATPCVVEAIACEVERTTEAAVANRLLDLGARIRRARIRRRLTSQMVSERCGMSRPTYRAIERGEPSVAIGRMAAVLRCLDMDGDIDAIASTDKQGRALVDAELSARSRVRK